MSWWGTHPSVRKEFARWALKQAGYNNPCRLCVYRTSINFGAMRDWFGDGFCKDCGSPYDPGVLTRKLVGDSVAEAAFSPDPRIPSFSDPRRNRPPVPCRVPWAFGYDHTNWVMSTQYYKLRFHYEMKDDKP